MKKKSVPKLDVIQKICDGFNVSLGEFFSDKTEDKEELSEDDMSIVASSRKLNASDRRRTLAYMQSLIDAN